MHRTSGLGIATRISMAFVLATACIGCSTDQSTASRADFQSQITVEPISSVPPTPAQEVGGLSQQAATFADRVSDSKSPNTPNAQWQRSVQWIDNLDPHARQYHNRRSQSARPRQTPHDVAPNHADVAAPSLSADDNRRQPTTSHAQLFRQLRQAIADDDAIKPLLKAMLVTTLKAIAGEGQFDDGTWTQPDDQQQQKLSKYHQLLLALRKDAATGDGRLEPSAIADHLDRLQDDSPIEIRTVRLVKTVHSFGVYDEFADNHFVAGRENPLIIYVELDHFRVLDTAKDRFQVHLAQELELYTASGGTMVWQHPPEDVLDECRNRRKDFFVRQLVRLPANLSVGKYLLKVRVSDRNGSSVDERSVPLVLVADSRLVADK